MHLMLQLSIGVLLRVGREGTNNCVAKYFIERLKEKKLNWSCSSDQATGQAHRK